MLDLFVWKNMLAVGMCGTRDIVQSLGAFYRDDDKWISNW